MMHYSGRQWKLYFVNYTSIWFIMQTLTAIAARIPFHFWGCNRSSFYNFPRLGCNEAVKIGKNDTDSSLLSKVMASALKLA